MYVIGTRHAATVEQIAQITKYGDGQYNPAREVLRYVAAVRKYYTNSSPQRRVQEFDIKPTSAQK
jgi:hypothetical protein